MLKLNQLQIDPYLTVGDHFRFLGCKTAYVYEKGQATNKVKGYRCQLALVDRGYETFYVTVPTAPEIPVDTPVRVTDWGSRLLSLMASRVSRPRPPQSNRSKMPKPSKGGDVFEKVFYGCSCVGCYREKP